MKQLICEMCGSSDMIKQGGMFVCQSCGTKYSVEEAKKMMIEGTVDVQGTVKVDNSEKLKNLYQIAKRARDNDEMEKAEKYYDMILQEKPDDWEASFYTTYYSAKQCKVGEIPSTVIRVRKNSVSSLKMIKESVIEPFEQKKAVEEVLNKTAEICTMLCSAYKAFYKKATTHLMDYINIGTSVFDLLDELSDIVDRDFTGIYRVDYWKSLLTIIDEHHIHVTITNGNEKVRVLNIAKKYIAKIREFEPNFVCPNMISFSLGQTKQVNESSDNGSTKKNGGCYVATAVYGSYDCPQVWTLRRYRDNILAETWYGRAFIRTYYAISPTIVKYFGDTIWFKKMWRGKLDRMVENLNSQGVEDTPYDDKEW